MIIADINYPVGYWLEFTKGSRTVCGILWIKCIYVNMHYVVTERRVSRLSMNEFLLPI